MTTYFQTIAKVFALAKSATTTADLEDAVYDFLSVLWDMPSDPTHEILMSAVIPNLASCVRFCETPTDLETIANGMRNTYFQGVGVGRAQGYVQGVSVGRAESESH